MLTNLILLQTLKENQNVSPSCPIVLPFSLHPSVLPLRPPLQAGAQISLADVSCSEERCTKWYNLLSRAYMPDISNKDKESRAAGNSDAVRTV